MRASLIKRLQALFGRSRFERNMREELRFHLEEHARALETQGLSAEEARRQACLAFGPLDALKDDARAAAGLRLVDGLRRDLVHAVRVMAKRPGFTATASMTLALGIGVNTLMFSATNGLLLRPLPFEDADSLVWVFAHPKSEPAEREGLWSPEVEAVWTARDVFEKVAVIGDMGLVREGAVRFDRWRGIHATASLFETLRVAPALGGVPARAGAGPRQIFIAHERWQRDFSADPSLVGRELLFADNKRFIVAGVLPPGLEFPFARAPHRGNGAGFVAGRQDFWVLDDDAPGTLPGGITIARLAKGMSASEAREQAAAAIASSW